MHTSQDHLEVCEAAARAGGRVLREWLGKFAVSNKGPRDLVTEADFASQREIRRILLDAFPDHGFIGEESQDESVAARAGAAGTAGLRWLVDPLDGTTNYVHGFPAYCVSVAMAQGDEILVAAIYDPVHEECFTARAGGGAFLNGRRLAVGGTTDPAEALVAVSFPPHVTRDSTAVADFLAVLPHVHAIRRTGSTAINLAYLACGRLDGFWVRRIANWDVAAGLLLVAEAGGAIGPFAGGRSGNVSLDDPSFIAACTPVLLGHFQSFMAGCDRSG
jgi:myo-inositol-1(or 4)-monophosphatase